MKVTRTLWNAFSKPATPISRVEFSKALAKIWSPSLQSKGGQEATIGLAISGGVDSMALAVLCSQLQQYVPNLGIGIDERKPQERLLPDLRFQAFVVDHDVRAGSDLEAQAVSEVLENRGIPTSILKIRWPRSFNPKEEQGFESLARKYRFRILGKACRDLRINSLLLAHHEDDQAETVLMRLLSGHRLAGLAGIRERSEIPENHGIYGVHESGGDLSDVKRDSLKENKKSLNHQLMYEEGGIQLYRPMLGFSKARLITTCEAEEMRWFEDHTNKDPSLTIRNSIRHLFANHKLPAALSKLSLLGLSATAREKLGIRKAAVDRWLSSDKIRSFETRSGTMIIRFPHIKRLKQSEDWSVSEKKQVAAELLRRILMLVTPEENIEVSSLHGAIARLFPEIGAEDDALDNDYVHIPTGFTIAGVQFQPEIPVFEDYEQLTESTSMQKRRKLEWFLSRQPLHSASSQSSRPTANPTRQLSKASKITKLGPKTAPETIDGKITWSPIFDQLRISEPSGPLLPVSVEQNLNDTSQTSTSIIGISHLGYTDCATEPSEYDTLDQVQLQISQYRTPRRILSAPASPDSTPASPTDLLTSKVPRNTRNVYIPSSPTSSWSSWALFDNRYWIRVFNPTTHPLHIKHFTRAHLTSFRNILPKPYRRFVQDLLKKVAPGNLRWTLPVLVKTERAWGWDSGEWRDQVVALPTLGVGSFGKNKDGTGTTGMIGDYSSEEHGLGNVMWEVRYKKINLDGISLSKDLLPSSAYAMDFKPTLVQNTTANIAEPRCSVCGSSFHIEESCWTAHPELKPVPNQTTTTNKNKEAMLGPKIIQGEELPGFSSATKKKILKRLAWLKVRRKAIKENRLDKNEKRKKKGGVNLNNGQ